MAASSVGSIQRHFRKLCEPRVQGRTRHLLTDIIVLAIWGVIANCLHAVRAWATEQHLLLLQGTTAARSHELSAIPKLLALLELHGALVTIDAMGCPKAIAKLLVDQGGAHVLTVKENQEHFSEDIQATLAKALDGQLPAAVVDQHLPMEAGHGRKEERTYVVIHDVEGIRERALWKQLTTVGICVSARIVNGQASVEARSFIGSRRLSAR